MSELVLITGGAGFIGSHTGDRLIEAGYRVRVLDSLVPQVHTTGRRPDYLHPEIELHVGDVLDTSAVEVALADVDYVYHLAADTGVGQSAYSVRRYFQTNVLGTAALWEAIQRTGPPIKRLVLSSSRAVYGEGKYNCPTHGPFFPKQRSEQQLQARDWWHYCPICSSRLNFGPTDEEAPLNPVSVYGLTKKVQEDVSIFMSQATGVPVTIFRYFNVYGPRQSQSNPYTGLIPLFCTRLSTGRAVSLYEDGVPVRDFVHVSDVARANVAAIQAHSTPIEVLNVGTGRPLALHEVAEALRRELSRNGRIEQTGKYRIGDILGCYADIGRARDLLGDAIRFEDGIRFLTPWLKQQDLTDRSDDVEEELRSMGVLREGR
jgi:dTDP-L-rhamnose 4-epimerase